MTIPARSRERELERVEAPAQHRQPRRPLQARGLRRAHAPGAFIAGEPRHVVGLEIRIDRLEAKRKLNQHHETRDREGALRGLQECGNTALAQAMQSTMSVAA